MLKYILTVLILLTTVNLSAGKPLLGISGITGNSPRTLVLSGMLENHLLNISNTSGFFEIVNMSLLKSELQKFKCVEEKCILRFAENSRINIIINGGFHDSGDSLRLTLRSYGTDIPYKNRMISRYTVEIPMYESISSREFSYICEEHAGRFISRFLSEFRHPVSLKVKGNELRPDLDEDINGRYDVYRFTGSMGEGFRTYRKTGEIKISNSRIVPGREGGKLRENDFIFFINHEKAEFYDSFYRGRKKELVFNETGINDTLYKLLLTVPASASMPFAAPVLGYYTNSDWSGLGLWSVNAAPYLYLEYRGLTDDLDASRSRRENLGRERITRNRFAWYMLLTGGASLFVDAFSSQYLQEASNYQGMVPLMGSSLSAGYLALISGGGGHFYRGYRSWGYLYFHLNNILLYYTIREFTPAESYNSAAGEYEKDEIDKKRAYLMAGAYGLLKTVEIIHAVLINDRISNGQIIEERSYPEPVVFFDEKENPVFGVKYSYHF
jgi:hypothetical protein